MGAVTQNGPGTLTLSAINIFTGVTTVNSGTLALSAGGGSGVVRGILNINAGATVVLNNGDALGFNTGGVSVDTININGGTLSNNSGGNQGFVTNMVLTGATVTTTGGQYHFNSGFGITSNSSSTTSQFNAPIQIRGTSLVVTTALGTTPSGIDLVASGIILNNAAFTKAGPGSLQLTATNTYTGATTVSGGTLQVGNGTTGSIASASPVVVSSGATLGVNLAAAGIMAITPASKIRAVVKQHIGHTGCGNRKPHAWATFGVCACAG